MIDRLFSQLRPVVGAGFVLLLGAAAATADTSLAAETPRPAARPACSEPIADLYDRVSAAVVSISTTAINERSVGERLTHTIGSGVIIDPSGLVLTNSHVVFGRQTIVVTLDDGTQIPAKLVGADPVLDLGLVRIPKPSEGKLPVATLGQSDLLRVGDDVFAIGTPFGFEQTLTRGVVSGLNRVLESDPMSPEEPLIQTDASINPGSSGGPLVDRCGAVVGVTTALLPQAQNIGFAIPIDIAKEIVPKLLADGRIVRPWLGVRGQMVTPQLQRLLRVPLVSGMIVESVEQGSPAEKAGVAGGDLELSIDGEPVLLGGDTITMVDGAPTVDDEALVAALHGLKVGAKVRLQLWRDGETREVELTTAERPAPRELEGAADESWLPLRAPAAGVRRLRARRAF